VKAVAGNSSVQKEKLGEISTLLVSANKKLAALEAATSKAQETGEAEAKPKPTETRLSQP